MNFVRLVQPSTAEAYIVALSPMVSCVRLVQLQNAPSSISVILGLVPKETLLKALHSKKAPPPIVVTLVGIDIDVNAEHSKNAYTGMLVVFPLNVTLLSFVHP